MIKYGDKFYILKRQIRKSMFTELSDVKDYKEYIHAEHVLQNGEFYMFVNNVDDIEFEEIPNAAIV